LSRGTKADRNYGGKIILFAGTSSEEKRRPSGPARKKKALFGKEVHRGGRLNHFPRKKGGITPYIGKGELRGHSPRLL